MLGDGQASHYENRRALGPFPQVGCGGFTDGGVIPKVSNAFIARTAEQTPGFGWLHMFVVGIGDAYEGSTAYGTASALFG